MPSSCGQKGMICISPTAPALDTAQRSKRLSTSITAITRPGGRRTSPGRCASQNTISRMRRRSLASFTMLRRRGSISENHTAESYLSAKQSALAMACATMARSSGSCCEDAAACASPTCARPASSAAALSLAAQPMEDFRNQVIDGDLGGFAAAAMAVFQANGGQPAVADHDAVGDAQQFGVGELHARTGIAVVIKHIDAGGVERGIQRVGLAAHGLGTVMVEGDEQHRS